MIPYLAFFTKSRYGILVLLMKTKKAGQKASTHYQNESVAEGLSYYRLVGETYHHNRLKGKLHRLVINHLNRLKSSNQKTAKLLDIGCDTGTDLFMLPEVPGITVARHGTDISHGAITQAKGLAQKRGESNITFTEVNANEPQPFADHSFDVVTSSELIEHIENPIVLFNEIARLLKPNGIAVITTPNEKSFQKFILGHLLPKSMGKNLDASRSLGFTRHGKNTRLDHSDWDKEAHISIYGAQQWKEIINKSDLKLNKMIGSSFYGGLPAFEKYPFLMGSMILLDSFINLFTFLQPHLQTCVIMQLSPRDHA